MKHNRPDSKETIRREVRSFPDKPGVYIMKDGAGTILYIGKANNLRKRAASYFTKNPPLKTKFLVDKVASVEHVVTKHEYEALLLENNLIKQWTPHYNINLKDGKTYPVIRITDEDFPRVFRTRRVINDGSLYFGPYTDVGAIDLYLELIEKLFSIRRCKGALKPRSNPCLYYHMHMCGAPCCGYIGKEAYGGMIEEVKKLLSGNSRKLQYDLKQKMEYAAESLEYEQAAVYRDSLQAVEKARQKQEVIDYIDEERDYIALTVEGTLCTFGVFQMRGGKLTGQEIIRAEIYENEEEAFEHFLLQYYTPDHPPPPRVYISVPIEQEKVALYFEREYNRQVTFSSPEKGRHFSLLTMAGENARIDLLRRLENKENNPALRELKTVLHLREVPGRIEGFDIAQLGGTSPVASLVSFTNGKPDKNQYRKYHIRSLGGEIDDFKAIREVIARRYTKVKNEGLEPPDLILLDGGKGQVSSAKRILKSLGMGDIPCVGLAKRNEEIVPAEGAPFTLPDTSPALRLLQHVRDEAHRFATTFQKSMREKQLDLPTLRQIPGIGEKRAVKLIQEFGSIDALTSASPEEISGRTGLPKDLADLVSGCCRSAGSSAPLAQNGKF
jgi:excinuclease ABC subunit C